MSEPDPKSEPPKLTHNEVIKAAIPTLAGNIAATVASGTDQFSADDQQFISSTASTSRTTATCARRARNS